MAGPEIARTARIRYRLTQQGHGKLKDAFITCFGEKRKFDSIHELDSRTVARIFYNQKPFDLSSLMVMFRALRLELCPDDYDISTPAQLPNIALSGDWMPSSSELEGYDPLADIAWSGEPDGGAEL